MSGQTAQRGQRPIARFIVQGQRPHIGEASQLCNIPFPRTLPSGAEVKQALAWFFLGIGMAVAAWYFGNWVIRSFRGPGVLFFGYGAVFIFSPGMIIFAIISFGKLFRSVRKKKADDAMRHMWVVALMGDDATNERFGKPAYALGVLRRMVPPGRPFEKGETMDYIESLRAALGKAADRHPLYRNGKPKDGLSAASPVISWRVEKEEELFPGVKELRGVMTFQDRLAASVNNKVVYSNAARLDVEVVQTFICSGGHWYPYEVASPIRQVGVGETENAKG